MAITSLRRSGLTSLIKYENFAAGNEVALSSFTVGGNYLGNGSLGDAVIASNTDLTVPNKNGLYDGDYVVAQYRSLVINSGVTLTTDQPCRGLFIYVQGNCTINGTLSMTQRGAFANPTVAGASDNAATSANGIQYVVFASGGSSTLSMANGAPFAGCGSFIRTVVANQPSASGNGRVLTLARAGASGGLSQNYTPSSNPPGSVGGNGNSSQTGGGAGGGGYNPSGGTATSGAGAAGTCFSGGSGGGAAQANFGGAVADAGAANGGQGGNGDAESHIGTGFSRFAGGGAGNPRGRTEDAETDVTATQPSDNGTGGIIWLVVGGALTVNTGGAILAQGGRGRAGGGGSGGGAIKIIARGTYTNSGTVSASGGDTSIGGILGGSGHVEVVTML